MSARYDKKTDRWEVWHDVYPITVRGRRHSLYEEKLAELASRYRNFVAEREPQAEDLL